MDLRDKTKATPVESNYPPPSLFPPLRITENSLWNPGVPCTPLCHSPTFVAERGQVPRPKAEPGNRNREGSKPRLVVVNLYFHGYC